MRPLISAGGLLVPSENVKSLEVALDRVSRGIGFPPGDEGEFKWSPGRELWMWEHLRGEERQSFFVSLLERAVEYGARAAVMISDVDCRTATGSTDHHSDVTVLLLERVDTWLSSRRRDAVVVVDRPGGSRGDEDVFLRECLETIGSGTGYVRFERIAINVLSSPSKLVRSLQLADVITGCTTAYVAGEDFYAPPVFEAILPLFLQTGGRIGGVGLKLHPLQRYQNLYHWLAGDEYYRRGKTGIGLPDPSLPYPLAPTSY
jgi:hypothetical protein